jgi:hypothetical protein
LTKFGERIILNLMKKTLLMGMMIILLLPLLFFSNQQENPPPSKPTPPPETLPVPPQEFPAKKSKYNYMNSFFSRNTKPLGLKEDQALKKLLAQKSITWAIRTEIRHILD